MSAPQERDLTPGGGQHKGLSKLIRKASLALRPRSAAHPSTDSDTAQGQQAPAAASSGSAARQVQREQVVAPVSASRVVAIAAAPSAGTAPSTARFASMNVHTARAPSAIRIPRPETRDPATFGKNQQEKAQLLFAKYGLTLNSSDWTAPARTGASEVQWVEKKIRMRVHRQCHHCDTSFGSTKECASCSHVRCKKCPRFPPKASTTADIAPVEAPTVTQQQLAPVAPSSLSKDVEMGDVQDMPSVDNKENVTPGPAAPIYLQIDPFDQGDKTLQLATSQIHQRRGTDVVYRPATHRVRRFCHKCEALFKGRATVCESCGHQRCPNCPRDPAKPQKYPTGYPGDVAEPEPTYPALERVWRKPRVRVRYTCEQCHTVYPSSGEKHCRGCKHVRCADCIRDPPRRSTREQPEELLRTLEGKFVGLELLPTEQGAEGTVA